MASLDLLRTRYLDELIGSTRMLESMESAAIAEAWASGAVAEWAALGGRTGALVDELAAVSELGSSLVSWIDGGEPPDSGAEWAADIGRHELRRVVRLLDSRKPGEVGWIFEFEAPSGDRHDLSATTAFGTLVGLSVGPEGLALAAGEDADSGFVVESASVADAVASLQQCLDQPLEELSESAEATVPLLLRRFDLTTTVDFIRSSSPEVPDREPDEDRYALQVIESALRSHIEMEAPPSVESARRRFEQLVRDGDADATTLFEVSGLETTSDVDTDLFVRLIGSYLAPVDLSPHTEAQASALVELEPADWIGVLLGLARASAGTEIDGKTLVGFINRAPEVTTTIPKSDADRIAWTFEQMLFAFEVTGVLDDQGAVTSVAAWVLPRAARAAWGASAQSS